MRSVSVSISMLLLAAAGLVGGAVSSAQAAEPAKGKNPMVIIETSMGTMKAELYQDKAPISVQNFLKYVDDKFYDGTIFHRVKPNFVIQGGGFDAKMTKKPTREPIKNEAGNGLKNAAGTLSMARTPIPDSATSQFYVNLRDNAFLDHRDPSPQGIGYAVFGKVVEGMDVVNKIAAVKTGTKDGMDDVPVELVVIKSVRRAK